MNRKLWRTGTLVLPALLVAASLLLSAGVAAGAGGLTATFAKSSDWGTGYVGVYAIRNAGTTSVPGWRLEFDLPTSAPVTSWWNGALTRNGTNLTVVNDTWNGTLAPGASTTFGFQVEGNVAPPAPAGCTLNGAPCSGGTAPPSSTTTTTTRPSTTTTTKPTTTTTTKPTTTTTTVPPAAGGGVFAPYADVTLWPPIDLTDTAAASGVKQFTLAFIVNGSGPCQAAWGGVIPLSERFLVEEVAALRAQGGDVIVSFGGAAGQELAQSCGTVAAL
ncbi:MAG: cellulose binding domain-containing protein, partial [Acidimicrobiales bacterium]